VERESLPNTLSVTAWTDDGEIMGLQHASRPVHGVQFHPESIATEHGHALLANFLDLTGVTRRAVV
jgi:anthranilate synthase component 2